jgi:feruloyl esterase
MRPEHAMNRPKPRCLVFLAAAMSVSLGATAAEAATRCADMTAAGDDLKIEVAELIQAGALEDHPNLPEHCHIKGMINEREGADGKTYGIGFNLRLPIDWNGRFVFEGGGGLDGILAFGEGAVFGIYDPSALARGYAVVTSDGGHQAKSSLDASFGYDQQARLDYAYNAMDQVTRVGKALVQRFYGATPEYSYFLGCSNGGRQAMMAAQRFPLYFDGIVAGNPAFRLARIAMDQVWNVQVSAAIAPKGEDGKPILSKAFSDADLKLVADGVLKKCDALDGLKDGMINDWLHCGFQPDELMCAAEKTDQCLSATQVKALHKLYEGPLDAQGKQLYGSFVYDTGIAGPAWRGMRLGTAPDGNWNAADVMLGFETLRQYAMTPPDRDFDPMTFRFPEDVWRTEEMHALGDADKTYINTFGKHGKMIVYDGLSDQSMAPGALADWYNAVRRDTGEWITDSVRLFMVPGMTHCGGGQSTDRFDMLTAIQAWVEDGKAPDRIIATGKAFPGISRPLCPYPKVARYDGGDQDSAESFACKE